MISLLVGTIYGTTLDTGDLTLLVGGVGYHVRVSDRDRRVLHTRTEENITVHVRTVVTENSISLYGFLVERDRSVFDRLCKVDKIGPSKALGVLSVIDGETVLAIVKRKAAAELVKLPGVGLKTADKIIEEMKTT